MGGNRRLDSQAHMKHNNNKPTPNFTTAAGEPDYGGVASGALAEPIPDPQAAEKRGEIINPCLDPGAAASTPARYAPSCPLNV